MNWQIKSVGGVLNLFVCKITMIKHRVRECCSWFLFYSTTHVGCTCNVSIKKWQKGGENVSRQLAAGECLTADHLERMGEYLPTWIEQITASSSILGWTAARIET